MLSCLVLLVNWLDALGSGSHSPCKAGPSPGHCKISWHGATAAALVTLGTWVSHAGAQSSGAGITDAGSRADSASADSTQPGSAKAAADGRAHGTAVTPAEQRALALATEAMEQDFLQMLYGNAEKKLRRAVQICLQERCSPPFRASLHRDIGIVYVGGMNRIEDGKDEFVTALSGDPNVAIPAEYDTVEISRAFFEVKRAIAAEIEATRRQDKSAPMGGNGGGGEVSDSAPKDGANSDDTWRQVRHSVLLGFQQDFLYHSSIRELCHQPSYSCWDAQNQPQKYPAGAEARGDEISGAGFRISTLRLLLGYERLVSRNFSVGLKLGMILSGVAPTSNGDAEVLMFHGEGRVTAYPGKSPFAADRSVRPFAFLSCGVAEVDSKVTVEIRESNLPPSNVSAWRRSGRGFLGIGGGAMFPIGRRHGPYAELRLSQMLGKTATVLGFHAGYAVSF